MEKGAQVRRPQTFSHLALGVHHGVVAVALALFVSAKPTGRTKVNATDLVAGGGERKNKRSEE